MSAKTLHCSFCLASQHDRQILIAGVDAYICEQCVPICVDLILAVRTKNDLKDAVAIYQGADA